ncbi:MAG: hypothetical protein J5772_06430 [Clostridia bacterium]|nr:hypothetical protein [Clostridia bacterium]
MYYAVIGDLVGSRRLSPEMRREAQAKLGSALEKVNAEFEPGVAARFLITLGDECQGLMNEEGDPVAAALTVMREMKPFEIRFAIGCGEITTPVFAEAAIGADGPAYYLARSTVEDMKADHGARLRAALSDPDRTECINTVAALCDRLSADWTRKQEELASSLLLARMRGEKPTQTELAKSLGVGQSTVNARLTAAGFNEYCRGMLYIRKQLREYMLGTEGGGERLI